MCALGLKLQEDITKKKFELKCSHTVEINSMVLIIQTQLATYILVRM